jgi:arylsulfatase A-like enzyme
MTRIRATRPRRRAVVLAAGALVASPDLAPRDAHAQAGPAERPSLVVVLSIDQFRGDYLDRFRHQLSGGLRRLESGGAVFTQAYHDHAITETAPGHAAILSGRFPVHTGIAANSEGVIDRGSPLIGSSETGASPRRFRGTTLADWMRAADRRTRVLSVSRKDRSAILPIGLGKGEVYWYAAEGLFTQSQYYGTSLPRWVRDFNAKGYPATYAGWTWTPLLPDSAYAEPDSVPTESRGRQFQFPHVIPDEPSMAAGTLIGFPVMDELTLRFALAGARELQLGADPRRTDLLHVALAATDAVGHRFGPDSKELHDQVLRLDRYLDAFLDSLFTLRDSTRVVIAVTSDHGMSPYPGSNSTVTPNPGSHGVDLMPTWRNAIVRMAAAGIDTMQVDFDQGTFLVGDTSSFVRRKLSVDSVTRALVDELRAVPGVARADLLTDLAKADTVQDMIARRWLHMFAPGGTVRAVTTLAPFNYHEPVLIATHGSPWDHDAWVPLIFWGAPFAPGRYDERVRVVDLAPTLAQVLGVRVLERVDGVVLRQAIR